MNNSQPIPENELERVKALSELDLDYSTLQDNFKDLTKLAAKISLSDISMVNLIDTYTQWTISSHGLLVDQVPREQSLCQYTIVEDEHFEVTDLSKDLRFKDKSYVSGDPHLKHYYGVPLRTNEGQNIGALCVINRRENKIDPEKGELLKIIANEIVNRIQTIHTIDGLRTKAKEANETKLKVSHDIRGPLSGIIGLAQYVSELGDKNKLDEVLQVMNMIHRSGNSILELADEILSVEKKKQSLNGHEFNLLLFKEKLEKLYLPQAMNKGITFTVHVNQAANEIPFAKAKLLQIAGNLISNAIKFTPEKGTVNVHLDVICKEKENTLRIDVKDSGAGLNEQMIAVILNGEMKSSSGTSGEKGFGFGLSLVKHLITGLKGTMQITSRPNEETTFTVCLPQPLA